MLNGATCLVMPGQPTTQDGSPHGPATPSLQPVQGRTCVWSGPGDTLVQVELSSGRGARPSPEVPPAQPSSLPQVGSPQCAGISLSTVPRA